MVRMLPQHDDGVMSSMLFSQLQTFVRIVDLGSLTAAAERSHLSQPAVSRQLKALEEDLGAVLCARRGRIVAPTAAGEIVYRFAQRVQALERELRRSIQTVSSPESGDISIACVDTVALYTLPRVLAPFSERYPSIRVHVRTGSIRQTVDRLLQHEADLALTTVPVANPKLVCRPLFDDPVEFVASPRLANLLPADLTPNDIGQLPMIAYEMGTNFRSYVDAALDAVGIHPHIAMEFDGHEAVRTMVKLGLGAAFMPLSAVQSDLDSGELLRLDAKGLPDLRRSTCLLLLRSEQPKLAVEHLTQEITRVLQTP